MADFKEGDRVQIVAREQTNDDIKNRSYYPYMASLKGTIYRMYNDGRAAIQIDLDSLPEAVLSRHTEAQERMKNRWIESLSEEARSRLTPEEKEFHLNYVLLVRIEDLLPEGKRQRSASTKKTATPPAAEPKTQEKPTDKPQAASRTRAISTESAPEPAATPEAPKRKTLKDIEKAEEEFLKSRRKSK